MGKTLEGLRLYQWGKEGTRGTLLAATSKIAVVGIDWSPDDSVYRPKLAKGILERNPGNETIITRGSTFKIPETPVIYDQIQNFLAMAIKGGITPSGVNPYTYAFARNILADPAPDTWTMERRLTDGASPKDTRWAYCFLSQIRFHYRIDQPLMFSAEGYGRRVQSNALTAALSMPNIEIPPAPLVQCWIDSAWANLGTTLIAGQVIEADVTYHTGLEPHLAFDGRSDLDFSTYIFDADKCGFDLELKIWTDTQYDTEKTAAEALTARAVRLKVLGTSSREFTLDMLAKHTKGSVFEVASDAGQDLTTLKLEDTNDGANSFSAKVVNAVSAFV